MSRTQGFRILGLLKISLDRLLKNEPQEEFLACPKHFISLRTAMLSKQTRAPALTDYLPSTSHSVHTISFEPHYTWWGWVSLICFFAYIDERSNKLLEGSILVPRLPRKLLEEIEFGTQYLNLSLCRQKEIKKKYWIWSAIAILWIMKLTDSNI